MSRRAKPPIATTPTSRFINFPWLIRVRFEPSPGELDHTEEEAKRAQRGREEDLAEAQHTLGQVSSLLFTILIVAQSDWRLRGLDG